MPVITKIIILPHEIEVKCQPVHRNLEIKWLRRRYSGKKNNMGDSPMLNAIIISLPTPNTIKLKKLTEISRGLIFKISFSLFLLRHFKDGAY